MKPELLLKFRAQDDGCIYYIYVDGTYTCTGGTLDDDSWLSKWTIGRDSCFMYKHEQMFNFESDGSASSYYLGKAIIDALAERHLLT